MVTVHWLKSQKLKDILRNVNSESECQGAQASIPYIYSTAAGNIDYPIQQKNIYLIEFADSRDKDYAYISSRGITSNIIHLKRSDALKSSLRVTFRHGGTEFQHRLSRLEPHQQVTLIFTKRPLLQSLNS